MKVINKLVRDNIPSIIEGNGGKCITRILDNDEYIEALDKKLTEEVQEYLAEPCGMELADILEVVYAIAEARGFGMNTVERIRQNKFSVNGGFDKRIFLGGVVDDQT